MLLARHTHMHAPAPPTQGDSSYPSPCQSIDFDVEAAAESDPEAGQGMQQLPAGSSLVPEQVGLRGAGAARETTPCPSELPSTWASATWVSAWHTATLLLP